MLDQGLSKDELARLLVEFCEEKAALHCIVGGAVTTVEGLVAAVANLQAVVAELSAHAAAECEAREESDGRRDAATRSDKAGDGWYHVIGYRCPSTIG